MNSHAHVVNRDATYVFYFFSSSSCARSLSLSPFLSRRYSCASSCAHYSSGALAMMCMHAISTAHSYRTQLPPPRYMSYTNKVSRAVSNAVVVVRGARRITQWWPPSSGRAIAGSGCFMMRWWPGVNSTRRAPAAICGWMFCA